MAVAVRPHRFNQLHLRYRRDLEAEVRRKPLQVQQMIRAAAECLVAAMEARDPTMVGHSQRVERYAVALGRALELPSSHLAELGLAAYVHDVGKLCIPDAILKKRSLLTADERAAVSLHPVIGERILKPFLRSEVVLEAVRHHHERIDGEGYPDGLRGAAIPLAARIIAVADVFDALTSDRVYHVRLLQDQAEDELARVAGSQLQPELVDAFLKVLAANPELTETLPAPSPIGVEVLRLHRDVEALVRRVP